MRKLFPRFYLILMIEQEIFDKEAEFMPDNVTRT